MKVRCVEDEDLICLLIKTSRTVIKKERTKLEIQAYVHTHQLKVCNSSCVSFLDIKVHDFLLVFHGTGFYKSYVGVLFFTFFILG